MFRKAEGARPLSMIAKGAVAAFLGSVLIAQLVVIDSSAEAAAGTSAPGCTTPSLQLVEAGPVVGGQSSNGCEFVFAVSSPVKVSITSVSSDATGVISAWVCHGIPGGASSCTEIERQTYINARRVPSLTDVDLNSPLLSGMLFVGSYDGGFTGPCVSTPSEGGCSLPYIGGIQLNTVRGVFGGILVAS